MSISFGVLGMVLLHRPSAHWSDVYFGEGEIRTMLFATVFVMVLLVLAYLTNPSEISFRAYLTEQSFRQHLSRLDDGTDDESPGIENVKIHYSLPSRNSTNVSRTVSTAKCDNGTFHFANRASVSLRTPKHVFRSFGVFTVAAVIPVAKCYGIVNDGSDYSESSIVADSWFIGAFGKWFRSGLIDSWYHEVVHRNKDEEGWTSGILGMKALDKRKEFAGLPIATKPRLSPGAPPKLRNRERSSQRLNGLSARNSSPPPLPKFASLPLHTTRLPSTIAEHRNAQIEKNGKANQAVAPPSAPVSTEEIIVAPPLQSRTPSSLFEQSPLIVDVLRQISASKSIVHELHTQLADVNNAAAQSRESLQNEVDSYRDRKRQEDASKLESKSRTKALDESKRTAESSKRDAEKRLKAAQNARDHATQRVKFLDGEINRLLQLLSESEASVQQTRDELASSARAICASMEKKKQEIKVAEDVVTALNARARDLEEKIAAEKDRLKHAKEDAEIRKQDRTFYPLHSVGNEPTTWTPIASAAQDAQPVDTHLDVRQELSAVPEENHRRGSAVSDPDSKSSTRPSRLSLGGLSNLSSKSLDGSQATLRAKGYSIFNNDLASLAQSQRSTFAPFDSESVGVPPGLGSQATSFVPTGLIHSIDGHGSNEISPNVYSAEGEMFIDPLHNMHQPAVSTAPVTTSPLSLHSPPSSNYEPSAFDVRYLPRAPASVSLEHLDRAVADRAHTDPSGLSQAYDNPDPIHTTNAHPRRWFSTHARADSRKGLNPDAQIFRFTRKPSVSTASPAPAPFDPTPGAPPSFDALNPNGLAHALAPGGTAAAAASRSLLRAFAPSPEEREALQRALGGSSNTSFERLPSLSDVGSIPPSPSHVPAGAAPPVHAQHAHGAPPELPSKEIGRALPQWLQSLPRIRKPNFSPWEDEEPAQNGAA